MLQNLAVAYHFLSARHRWATLRGPALTDYRRRRLARVLNHAWENAPFYRDHWRGAGFSHAPAPQDWPGLPPVDKRLMMEHFSAFNTHGVPLAQALDVAQQAENSRYFQPRLGSLTVGLSSGTSGERGLFLVSPAEQAAWAGAILARTLAGRHDLGRILAGDGLRVAFFLRSNSNLYEQTRSRAVRFRYFDLAAPLAQAVQQLNDFQPQALLAPPRLLAALAARQQAGELYITPRQVISISDVLEEHDRAQVTAAFGRPPEQIYQCTEGLLAVCCAAGSLHVQEDLVWLEWEELPASPAGGPRRCNPLVTDLQRATQPIIRYRLNDIIQLSDQPCPCGSPYQVIQAIEGRCADIGYFPDRHHPLYPADLRQIILDALGQHPDDYLGVQERDGHLRLHLKLPGDFDAAAARLQSALPARLAALGCRLDELEITPTLPELAPYAKRRRLRRL